jgi:hypothetical protein
MIRDVFAAALAALTATRLFAVSWLRMRRVHHPLSAREQPHRNG